jgi:hypothetical protein
MCRTFGKDARKLNPGGILVIIKQKKKLPGMFNKGGKEQTSFLCMEQAESFCSVVVVNDNYDDDDDGRRGRWMDE